MLMVLRLLEGITVCEWASPNTKRVAKMDIFIIIKPFAALIQTWFLILIFILALLQSV